MTTIYFIRHSKTEKSNYVATNDSLQVQNEKEILSIEGEALASKRLNMEELQNIDVLISSNYIRALATAKYIANYNGIDIQVMDSFGERKFGITSWDEVPDDFYLRQFLEVEYKIGSGESQGDVRKRMLVSLKEVLRQFRDKRVVIVTHSTALLFLLMHWCDVDNDKGIFYHGEFVAPIQIENCAIFKMVFDDNDSLTAIVKV